MNKKQKKVLYRILLSAVLFIAIAVTERVVSLPKPVSVVLYLIPYLVIGYDILKKAWKGILKRQVFDENFLMAVATIGAFCLGEFSESVAVMLFYQIGELFQSIAVGKSRKNISSLMDIRPDYANLLRDGSVVKVSPDEVEIGSTIMVNVGEKVPLDGVIIEGTTTLNTSALTGESMPREAETGSEIFSGCINLSGVIQMKTTKEFGESTVSKILDLVENSAMKKSQSENFITKFAKYYTPIVCYGALALALLPPLFSMLLGVSPKWGQWVIRALTFLVISCPCALVISIPLTFFGGIGCASGNGILVKGSNYLEALSKARYIVFDKTGTLTEGVFEVSEIHPANDFDTKRLLHYAAYAEATSSHPISASLIRAYQSEPNLSRVKNIREIAGHGVEATVDGKQVLVGNARLMEKAGLQIPKETPEGTVCHVAVENEYAGYIQISDVIKPSSARAVQELKRSGVKKTVMLTGDANAVAEKTAEQIGLDEYHAQLLPADKVKKVEAMLEEKADNEKLAFVGDGINDAPVLSRADIGIAMGAMGSDAAIEAADIVLMDDDPMKIALAMRIAKKTLTIAKENIVFALTVKIACLVLGAVGLANMWLAIFADVGVMVLAVINATRALRVK